MDYYALRAIAQGNPMSESYNGLPVIETLEEAAQYFPLDEAYFGRQQVAPIQAAMDRIYATVMANPTVNLNGSSENKALEQAFCKAFGVKAAHVYWSIGSNLTSSGPCTVPSSRIFNPESKSVVYGKNKNGFYDDQHRMTLFIEMDTAMFTLCGITSEEAVAIILHETGHNFDFTPWTVVGVWYYYAMTIINAINYASMGDITTAIKYAKKVIELPFIQTTPGRFVYTFLMHMKDMILNIIPPVGMVVRAIGGVVFDARKVIGNLLGIVTLPTVLGTNIVMAPLLWVMQIPARKKEIYADTFAASYGYASEQVTALDKLQGYMRGGRWTTGPLTGLLYDITMTRADILTQLRGGHTSNQQRGLNMLDKLNRDLNDSALSPEAKAAIAVERDRLQETYNTFITSDADTRLQITSAYRQMVDSWYNGKPYILMPNDVFGDNYAR